MYIIYCFALIYGAEELEKGQVKGRDLGSGKEFELPRKDLLSGLAENFAWESRDYTILG